MQKCTLIVRNKRMLFFLILFYFCTSHLPTAISAVAETERGDSLHLERRNDGDHKVIDVTVAYSLREKSILRISAVSASCLSVLATTISLYWLLRMKQVFRHRLISLVIFGDFIKALFHLIIAAVKVMVNDLASENIICQISGFFIHFGAEISVFFVSLHIALQVLCTPKPNAAGLLNYRHLVYTANILIPCILVSCTFTKSKRPYVREGPFCHLPVRPLPYRLALYWIPRYIVWISILGLAIAMYFRIKFKLNIFEEVEKRSSTSLRANSVFSHQLHKKSSCTNQNMFLGTPKALKNKVARLNRGSQGSTNWHEFSTVSWNPEKTLQLASDKIVDQENIRTPSDILPKVISPRSAGLRSTLNDGNRTAEVQTTDSLAVNPDAELIMSGISTKSNQTLSNLNIMAKSRRRIRKQLRLLFVYPAVYLLMWTIPLIAHGFKYSDRYARQPLYILSLLSLLFRILIGTVDCIVFCIREKPWHHISCTNGTIIGSFSWKQGKRQKVQRESQSTLAGTPTSPLETPLASPPNSIREPSRPSDASRRSGYSQRLSSDVCQTEIKKAYDSLELEQFDRKKRNHHASKNNDLNNS